MMNVLARPSLGVLEDFARSNALLAFDYDGTLAPIVDEPDAATMRPKTRTLLEAVARSYPVVVISGRAQTDITRRLRGIPLSGVVGNHGIESWRSATPHGVEVRRWLPALERVVTNLKGVTIENKSYSLAVHYRRSREKKRARAAILAAAAALSDIRVIAGKQVLNLLPSGAPHKGVALERERARLGCDTAIYVGDDKADEDVFELDQPGRLLTIRVGPRRGSAAMYAISDQSAIDDLLQFLAELRRGNAGRAEILR
jgi:trehalose 6-phosphate phosphatase